MTSNEIRQRFLTFFEKRGHAIIPSASLVPENDPSVLFNTAGMQPLVPYLLGEKHPQGTRLADVQKCVRTNDIDEVGDNTHLTFFEMLGNWSLGDYWKSESINWSYELLTSKEEGFGLDPQRLYVTCFEGDENAPRDEESATIWKEIFEKNGVTGERIYFRPANKNWWSAGPNGPCGPDTEMFYDLTGNITEGMSLEQYLKADDEQKVVEIWNNVFMEFLSKDGKVVGKLENKNVDTGAGFERMIAVVQGKSSVFETDIFSDLIKNTKNLTGSLKNQRIIADHIRTAVFMIVDGVSPSNTDRGYILRRLLRRAVLKTDKRKLDNQEISSLVNIISDKYEASYPEIKQNLTSVTQKIEEEVNKFTKTLEDGIKQFEKGIDPFVLFTTYGFPIEITKELAKERGTVIDEEKFNEEFKKHQELSRAGSEQKFKGGLAGTGEVETKYHTATHLLHQALRDVLGESVQQKGSNITTERLRFDFAFERKMTDEEKKKVEDIVNEKIQLNLPVKKEVMKKEEAEKTGALHFFGEKYPDEVNVYYIGDSLDSAYSKEFCGGPHVENTGVLGRFKIAKEEAVSAGVRRIKAVLE
ncbi:MAG: alanine--tRNA ligase [Parcubacteria bacterium C7867-006]|nr:MAG: alanine--tRNA ligase [Parcubacteria bacterium C7867-006]